MIIGRLNNNATRNMLVFLEDVINRSLDVSLFSETKLDDSFLSAQFILKGFGVPDSFDRNSKRGGLSYYIHEDLYSSNSDLTVTLNPFVLR